MAKASWAGAKMVPHQISYEAPPLFVMLHAFFQDKNFIQLEKEIVDNKTVKSEDIRAFKAYAAAFYQYMGDYHSFGSKKFMPEMNSTTFHNILIRHPLYNKKTQKGKQYKQIIDEIYPQVERELFSVDKPYTQLGYPEEHGNTAYFGQNMNKNDLILVKDFLDAQNVSVLNTRAFKPKDHHFIITVGSVDQAASKKNVQFKNATFDLQYGEFGNYLKEVNKNLAEAKKYAANEHQEKMIDLYIKHFQSGDINVHKDSQREWVKDKGPSVETNLGWVEKYVDPQNIRAMWSGWVAFNDKDRSKKFHQLVQNSEKIVPKLPWERSLENSKFMAPDFSSLDIMTFAGDRLPSGINIPNYYDIREHDGFKNVIFENKAKASNKTDTVPMAHMKTLEETITFNKHQKDAYKVQVAGHELFGHGSGKLIYKDEKTGKCPQRVEDPINPGQFIESCYEKGETYSTKFGDISTSFEECRADLSGLYLQQYPDMYSLFGWNNKNSTDLHWISMMQEFRKGILGLATSYNKERAKWNQAHTQGAFVISQFIMQNQKSNILKVSSVTKNKTDDFILEVNKQNFEKEGIELIKKMLHAFQVYKSLAAVDKAREFYAKYSKVDDKYLHVQEMLNSKPKHSGLRLFQNLAKNSTTIKKFDNDPNLKKPSMITYQNNFAGVIKSYIDRIPFSNSLYQEMIGEWNKTKSFVRVPESALSQSTITKNNFKSDPTAHPPPEPAKKEKTLNKKTTKKSETKETKKTPAKTKAAPAKSAKPATPKSAVKKTTKKTEAKETKKAPAKSAKPATNKSAVKKSPTKADATKKQAPAKSAVKKSPTKADATEKQAPAKSAVKKNPTKAGTKK